MVVMKKQVNTHEFMTRLYNANKNYLIAHRYNGTAKLAMSMMPYSKTNGLTLRFMFCLN